jgi:hypothetical protein
MQTATRNIATTSQAGWRTPAGDEADAYAIRGWRATRHSSVVLHVHQADVADLQEGLAVLRAAPGLHCLCCVFY